ncbi:hypothetical protein [Endozoicomonas sp. SCSIO W0465]|uniref:hypothetical protein n=1 Tax=Endozoicomonas sp. SCSIO W0465 TaxID=2918516 RepID=UPI002074F9D9|nr:hypothetical protein [Endozoicomonas sp. SCSIO W0465]USE38403.1 hypothetical protein MJO57_09670 [Endozoicomonas sp. SCSIO W0465]
MSSCPISNFIGNRCMPDPVRAESEIAKNYNFAEEASFFAALFKHLPVRPVPDPALIMVLNKQWLERKKRKVTKKGKSEPLWLGKKADDEPSDEWDKSGEV